MQRNISFHLILYEVTNFLCIKTNLTNVVSELAEALPEKVSTTLKNITTDANNHHNNNNSNNNNNNNTTNGIKPTPSTSSSSPSSSSSSPPFLFPPVPSLKSYNDKFLAEHAHSPRHLHGGLRARALLSPETKAQNERELLGTLDFDDSKMDLESAVQGLQLLVEWNCDREFRTRYLDRAKERYPDATVFRNATAVIT